MGRFVTFDRACRTLPPLPEEITFDDDSAWHGARSSTWATRPWPACCGPGRNWCEPALTMRRWMTKPKKWPGSISPIPTIPTANGHPRCRRRRTSYILTITRIVLRNLLRAEMLVGGVPRDQLKTDPAETIKEILGPQQQLILAKAEQWLATGSAIEKARAARARMLIQRSQAVDSLRFSTVLLSFGLQLAC